VKQTKMSEHVDTSEIHYEFRPFVFG